jgi:tetratricopeptide (TPR) repeat protein
MALPFANLSGDPGQDYLADALTDQLTTALARLRGSVVIAHSTALTYKGKPADDLKRADVLLSKALALDPNYPPGHLVRAFALQSQFRLDEAIAEGRRALDLDPSLVDAYWHTAIAYCSRLGGELGLDSVEYRASTR